MKNQLVTNQIEISLKEVAPFTNGDLAFHRQRGHRLMAWSPLGGGDLMDKNSIVASVIKRLAKKNSVDHAAVAVAFLLTHPAGILPVLDTNTLSRISTISDALRVKLDRQDWFEPYEATLGREVA